MTQAAQKSGNPGQIALSTTWPVTITTEVKKKALFIKSCSIATLMLAKDLIMPKKVVTATSAKLIGALTDHLLLDGQEVPVAYYSRTLFSAERNYAQIDKEGLAIVAGIKKFHETAP